MDKRKLVDSIAKETDFSKKDSALALNAVLSVISDTMARKERVTLMGFGTFYTKMRQAKKARNPKTGESINIPKRIVAKWRVSPELQSKVK